VTTKRVKHNNESVSAEVIEKQSEPARQPSTQPSAQPQAMKRIPFPEKVCFVLLAVLSTWNSPHQSMVVIMIIPCWRSPRIMR
jgi:hypothetical protein